MSAETKKVTLRAMVPHGQEAALLRVCAAIGIDKNKFVEDAVMTAITQAILANPNIINGTCATTVPMIAAMKNPAIKTPKAK